MADVDGASFPHLDKNIIRQAFLCNIWKCNQRFPPNDSEINGKRGDLFSHYCYSRGWSPVGLKKCTSFSHAFSFTLDCYFGSWLVGCICTILLRTEISHLLLAWNLIRALISPSTWPNSPSSAIKRLKLHFDGFFFLFFFSLWPKLKLGCTHIQC